MIGSAGHGSRPQRGVAGPVPALAARSRFSRRRPAGPQTALRRKTKRAPDLETTVDAVSTTSRNHRHKTAVGLMADATPASAAQIVATPDGHDRLAPVRGPLPGTAPEMTAVAPGEAAIPGQATASVAQSSDCRIVPRGQLRISGAMGHRPRSALTGRKGRPLAVPRDDPEKIAAPPGRRSRRRFFGAVRT